MTAGDCCSAVFNPQAFGLASDESINLNVPRGSCHGKIIELLRPFSHFESLIERHFATGQAFSIASPLVLGALPYVKKFIEREIFSDDELANIVTENTRKPIEVTSSLTADRFHELFTGNHMRWEFVGYLFACAGRSAMVHESSDAQFMNGNLEIVDRDTYVHQLFTASLACILQCRQTGAAVNDILIWLLYENLLFSTMQYGDSSL